MEGLSTTSVWTRRSDSAEKRDLWAAMKRGFRGRCPRCGVKSRPHTEQVLPTFKNARNSFPSPQRGQRP